MNPRIGIWHPGASSNHGDRAIQLATIDLVHELYPTAEIVQYHTDVDEAARIYEGEPVITEPLGRLGAPGLRALRQLDLLLWGGGSLVQQSSLFHFPRHAVPALLAKRVGTPVVGFGSGVEPLSNPALKWLARHCFDHVFTDAFVRGNQSAELLRSYGVTAPVRVAVDQAVSLRPSSAEAAAGHLDKSVGVDVESTPIVTVSVKPSFIYRGGLLPVSIELPGRGKRHRARLRAGFEEAFANLLDHVTESTEAIVVMVPMYGGQGDVEAAERVLSRVSRTERVRIMRDLPNSRVLKAVFGMADVHVGVRLHSCILATSAGVPSLGVPYMVKATEYFEHLGLSEHTVNEKDVTSASLQGAFSRLWDRRDAVRAHLAKTLPAVTGELKSHSDSVLRSVLGAAGEGSSHRARGTSREQD